MDGLLMLMEREEMQNRDASVHLIPGTILESISFVGRETDMGEESLMMKMVSGAIMFKDVWLVPSHINRNHWVLFLILIRRKYIIVLDSMHGNKALPQDVRNHLQVTFAWL